MIKYGIQIPWIDGDYMWVTQGDPKFQLKPVLYYSYEEAVRVAKTVWGEGAIVKIYEEPREEN